MTDFTPIGGQLPLPIGPPPEQRFELDTCELPDLMDGESAFPPGAQFACPHFVWEVQMRRSWGGRSQVQWVSTTSAPPTALQVDAGLVITAMPITVDPIEDFPVEAAPVTATLVQGEATESGG